MISESDPLIWSALLGTLFTYALTALGAALVFVVRKAYRKMLDSSLGFAAGVMTAASFWSLIAPAIEMADESGLYGDFSFVPIAIGLGLGAGFVCLADVIMVKVGARTEANLMYDVIMTSQDDVIADTNNAEISQSATTAATNGGGQNGKPTSAESEQKLGKVDEEPTIKPKTTNTRPDVEEAKDEKDPDLCNTGLLCMNKLYHHKSWHRILLLVIAITVHNIPEGLAVGVAFGAVGKSKTATFASARSLALGIGIQNFPEGLAVSLPLRALGMPAWKAFLWGQFSGMVEPIAGLFGCWAVSIATPVLPYALAFAAGAMIWVVMDDIMPEAHSAGNGKLASIGSILGFIVMMSLDVALG